ncbi:hypothetical protein GYMLUDRAFT_250977 [Collybiopsis luxurians FD-317 M1]|uniref:Unplaced genomic scaffold GYMLUscaffold_90, whole genome shotgun sequence n=1 Tax=Collybiopsis luxurians FD-317 M1 TaxID=944289 RepID=A0A0D0BDS8_9AGAR|nr:hypothetical protein GYMLUDRAFT_250977 [Collybiopsis luxurians FD-317 M1]
MVRQYIRQWRSCQYKGQSTVLSQLFSNPESPNPEFPILEELAVSGLKGSNVTDFDFFEHSPNLQAVTSFAPNPSSKLPLRQLIKITASLDSRIGMIFELCPNIITAELRQRNVRGLYPSRGLAVQRSSSPRSLTLAVREIEGDCFVEEVFRSHSLPALTELHICAFDTKQRLALDWPKEAFGVFLSNSACSITTLSFCNVGLRDSDLITILRLLPSVVDFQLQDQHNTKRSPVTSLLISCLHDGPNDQFRSSPLLPNLLSLLLDTGKDASFNDAVFVSMTRWLPEPDDSTDALIQTALQREHGREVLQTTLEFGPASSPRDEVEEMILLLNRDLADSESEIAHLQSRILFAEVQKKRLLDYKKSLQFLLSPIRRLLNETLGRVFTFACDMNTLE